MFYDIEAKHHLTERQIKARNGQLEKLVYSFEGMSHGNWGINRNNEAGTTVYFEDKSKAPIYANGTYQEVITRLKYLLKNQ